MLERKSTSQPALLRHILIIPIVIKFQLKAYFHNLYFMMFLFDCHYSGTLAASDSRSGYM